MADGRHPWELGPGYAWPIPDSVEKWAASVCWFGKVSGWPDKHVSPLVVMLRDHTGVNGELEMLDLESNRLRTR